MDYKALLLSPRGRINRKVYWLSALGLAVASLVLQGLGWASMSPTMSDDGILHLSTGTFGSLMMIIVSLASLVLAWVGLMLAIKRCHDRGRTGWFLFAGLIPFVGGIWLIVELGFLRGTVGPNRFGPDPLPAMSLGYSAA